MIDIPNIALEPARYEQGKMNYSGNIPDGKDDLVFKGVFFELYPITIPLCIVVVLQNTVIFLNYYKERTKLVACLFMGIAIADILKAQGELVLSLTSILVYKGVVKKAVLYKSLYYYMVTALPGVNWSKLCNLVMTIILTIKVVNPFNRINTSLAKKVVVALGFAIVLLHVSDMIAAAVFLDSNIIPGRIHSKAYRYLVEVFGYPGLPCIVAILCMPDHQGVSKCDFNSNIHFGNGYNVLLYSYAAILFLCIPLTVFICMIIQIRYLRRSLQEHETSSQMSNTANHVTVTVLCISVLFFLCNAAYFLMIIIWFILHEVYDVDDTSHNDRFYVRVGVFLGLTEFSLPLIYAVVYPIILISRKQELRQRYGRYWRRLANCCGMICFPNSDIQEEEQ
jgi:hypothetical protein